ncbi:MAG: class I adenylate-forming enzyme family protein [Acidimicrobiales bacterium]|nr:acyl--CoA ligase [Acidimicrobiales bacterium]MDG1846697.1 class I adenylate-forming enzyme family protein [Acidimicrobiales bacterium]
MPISFEEASSQVCAPGTLFEIVETEIRGILTKSFVGTPPNICSLYQMASQRNDEFIIYEDERWTMPELLNLAGKIGNALLNKFGVAKGDRVAIAMRNYPEWIAAFTAITSIGAIAVPLNAWWQSEELSFALKDSGSKIVFADNERIEHLPELSGESEDLKIIGIRTDANQKRNIISIEDILEPDATMPEVSISPDDNLTILYTSGTTGTPKGAVSTHRAILSALLAFSARAQIAEVMEPTERSDGKPLQTSFMLCVPLFHVTGLIPIMLGSFVGGSKLVMTHKWKPDRALELIEKEKVTHFIGVPTMSWDLLEAPMFEQRDTSSLRSVGGGGAPMPPELVKRIDENFKKGRPGLGYGMTETNAYGPQNTGQEFVDHPTSTGRPVPIMQLRVTDPDGNVLGPGETGELWFNGPTLITEYWNRPEASAETIVDGWLKSGDIGRIDEDGRIYVSDRVKDMVLRGGENIYCAEVEAAIYEIQSVYECSVYGVPDERLGERVACHIMVKSGMKINKLEIVEFLQGKIASFKIPETITIVDIPLPRNASGKILKRELREEAIEGL